MSKIELLIGGKKYEGSFGLFFLGECLEITGLQIDELVNKNNSNPLKYTPILIYESIKIKNDIDFTLEELIELLDSKEGWTQMGKFNTAFRDSLNKYVPKEEPTVDAGPKKK